MIISSFALAMAFYPGRQPRRENRRLPLPRRIAKRIRQAVRRGA